MTGRRVAGVAGACMLAAGAGLASTGAAWAASTRVIGRPTAGTHVIPPRLVVRESSAPAPIGER
jgi:hypothetical protein